MDEQRGHEEEEGRLNKHICYGVVVGVPRRGAVPSMGGRQTPARMRMAGSMLLARAVGMAPNLGFSFA